MDLGFTDKVALVTGASRGIGMACAQILSEEGARVAMVARNKENLENAVSKQMSKYRSRVICISSDLSKIGSAEEVVKISEKKFGRIDILINSAGSSKAGKFEELSEEDWNSALQLKFLGAVRMVRAVLPIMKKQGQGRIVNVAGNTGRQPHPNLLPGSTSNAALLAFTKGISEEIINDGIYINALQPGPTRTEHWDQIMQNMSKGSGLKAEEFETEFMKQIPMGRIAEPLEMARPVIFMASMAASFMTGRSIIVDGGWTKDLA